MTILIKHTHGITETAADLDEAMARLEAVYGDEIETEGDIDEGRVLVWRDEESAKDDPGARAVASLILLVD
jgi:hypothetical protein